MNTILIHGDHVIKGYDRLQKFLDSAKNRGWEIAWFDKDQNLTLAEIISGRGLFFTNKLVVVKGFSLIKKRDLDWLKNSSSDILGTLVIYEGSELSQTKIRELPKNTKVEVYKLPKIIFTFLDSLYPGNGKRSVEMFHEVLKGEPAIFIFSLIARTFRDLYWIKVSPQTIPYPGWRYNKLKKQSSNFSTTKLREIINLLAEADIRSKTSEASLEDSLDLIIITQLE